MSTADGSPAGSSPPTQTSLIKVLPTRQGFLGAFAARAIKAGSLVVNDPALFVVDAPLQHWLFSRAQAGSSGGPTPVEGEEDAPPAKDFDEFMDRAIRQMLSWKTEEQRTEFWYLANTHQELPLAYGIFATNAIQLSPKTFSLSSPVLLLTHSSFAEQRENSVDCSPSCRD